MNFKTERKKLRVLVFPCGTEIGLEIHQALKWSTYIELYGASSISSNHGKYVYKNYIEGLPFVDDSAFIKKLNDIVDSYHIDLIYPAHDSVVLNLSENQSNLHSNVIGSMPATCRICRSKKKTYQYLKKILNVPKVYESLNENVNYPLFLKPDVGQGSKGIYLAQSLTEAECYMQKDPTLVPMEYIPGPEYTIDCFTDRHGILRFVGPRKRVRITNGISVNSHPVNDTRLDQMAEAINSTLKFQGAWFFQAKERADGDLTLLEIAPRIAGTMGLYRNLGVNLALLSVFDRLDMDVDIFSNKYPIDIDRALISRFKMDLEYKNVYIDLDDTIIFNSSVNVWIVAFLYQCINKGIKVHLLSRHDGDIKKILNAHRLAYIFDTITCLDKTKEKTEYITERSSIFIDDSFSERQSVSRKLGIPTFDTNSIESLIDWKS